jgi:hypothetical protein
MSIFTDWPHNWYGFWKDSPSAPYDVPLFSELVDETWAPPDKDEILKYLIEAPSSLASVFPPERCTTCGELLENIGGQSSDGIWIWPATLPHFVGKHHVRLPDRMVERIRAKGYRPVPEDVADEPQREN